MNPNLENISHIVYDKQLSLKFQEYLKRKGVVVITSKWQAKWQNTSLQNGTNKNVLFNEVYNKYVNIHLPTISESSRVTKIKRCSIFLKPLVDIKMINFTPHFISEFINFSKDTHIAGPNIKYNYDKQLKDISSIFNFWTDHFDFRFTNPVKKHHYKLGILRPIEEKDRQINIDEFNLFLSHLNPFFKDLARVQFVMAGRIGETAGIQAKRINLSLKLLTVKEVLVWIKGVPKIKNIPKTGETRVVHISETLENIFKRHLENMAPDCPFIFHRNGNPLRYNMINEHYNRAWKKAGLSHKFSGSHIIRYCSASFARKISGSLDAARSVTGHRSSKMAEKYSCYFDNDLNRKTVIDMEIALKVS